MEAAMAMIHSQPHLSRQSYSDLEDDDGSSSSGELLHGGGGATGSGGRTSSSLRRRSYGDVAILPAGGASGAPLPRSSKPPPRHGNGRGGTTDEHAVDANCHVWTTDEHAAEAYFHVSVAPGYLSFEDVIGGTALYRDRSGQPLEAAISDPLMRTASRLYVREDGRSHHCRQQSPGPLGTRRGSAMHAIIKNPVCIALSRLVSIYPNISGLAVTRWMGCKSLSCQPCDQEGDPFPGTELKEIWRAAPAPQSVSDKYQYTHFAHKISSFDTAPKKLSAPKKLLASATSMAH